VNVGNDRDTNQAFIYIRQSIWGGDLNYLTTRTRCGRRFDCTALSLVPMYVTVRDCCGGHASFFVLVNISAVGLVSNSACHIRWSLNRKLAVQALGTVGAGQSVYRCHFQLLSINTLTLPKWKIWQRQERAFDKFL
jgi:hypothetical protein